MLRIITIVFLTLLVLSALAARLLVAQNDYQTTGTMTLPTLSAPVTVTRDALMIPYIQANNIDDAIQAQGFITAQERTYQIMLYRLIALGRLAEVFGERALNNDILIHLIDLQTLAAQQINALDEAAKRYYRAYVQGINAYLERYQQEHPLAVKLLGFKPEQWTLNDIVTIQLFQSWANGTAWKTDLINLQLIDEVGAARAQQIAQLTINPDDGSRAQAILNPAANPTANTTTNTSNNLALHTLAWLDVLPNALSAGSNAWASGARRSSTRAPILANNPHLPVGNLPGFWLPMALLTPTHKAVGMHSPGSPGIGVGRNQHIAWGATIGGSDGTDLYIEELDPNTPDHYLEGSQSLPMTVREVAIKIKDNNAMRSQQYRFRSTRRGPLISDYASTYNGNRALSLRWAQAQTLHNPSLGSDRLLFATNLAEAQAAVRLFPGALSHIIASKQGGIARVSSGSVPIRRQGDGAVPLAVAELGEFAYDNWQGIINSDDMPALVNPQQDWVGTANHRIIDQDYPYQYSKNFATAWRYRRIKEYFEQDSKQGKQVSVNDHWALINDVKNPLAQRLSPLYIHAMQTSHPAMANALREWDYNDRAEYAAPAIFQSITKHLAMFTFADELSEALWQRIFDTPYFWQERLFQMLQEDAHPWFDNQNTNAIETKYDILNQAIAAAKTELSTKLGDDVSQWRWGDLHTITFNSPVIKGKMMAQLFGAGTHPIDGSGETLNRSYYQASQGYDTYINDSVRLVVDLYDDEKVLAVIPGGISARYFNANMHNQVSDWLHNKANPIWLNTKNLKKHSRLELTPQQ